MERLDLGGSVLINPGNACRLLQKSGDHGKGVAQVLHVHDGVAGMVTPDPPSGAS